MFDPPINAKGTITGNLYPKVYEVELPNGKKTVGHVPKAQQKLHEHLTEGVCVHLEMTPFDFEKARIVAIADGS